MTTHVFICLGFVDPSSDASPVEMARVRAARMWVMPQLFASLHVSHDAEDFRAAVEGVLRGAHGPVTLVVHCIGELTAGDESTDGTRLTFDMCDVNQRRAPVDVMEVVVAAQKERASPAATNALLVFDTCCRPRSDGRSCVTEQQVSTHVQRVVGSQAAGPMSVVALWASFDRANAKGAVDAGTDTSLTKAIAPIVQHSITAGGFGPDRQARNVAAHAQRALQPSVAAEVHAFTWTDRRAPWQAMTGYAIPEELAPVAADVVGARRARSPPKEAGDNVDGSSDEARREIARLRPPQPPAPPSQAPSTVQALPGVYDGIPLGPSPAEQCVRRNGPAKAYWCHVCAISISGDLNARLHAGGKQHTNKFKIVESGGVVGGDLGMQLNPENYFRCECCDTTISGETNLHQHLAGARHKSRELQWRQQNGHHPGMEFTEDVHPTSLDHDPVDV
jgi:hypothetical protein